MKPKIENTVMLMDDSILKPMFDGSKKGMAKKLREKMKSIKAFF